MLNSLTLEIAQDRANNADEDVVVVTGSRRNVNPNLTSARPVLVVSSDEIACRGTVNIEDLTNNLPQVLPGKLVKFQMVRGGPNHRTISVPKAT